MPTADNKVGKHYIHMLAKLA